MYFKILFYNIEGDCQGNFCTKTGPLRNLQRAYGLKLRGTVLLDQLLESTDPIITDP